MSETEIIFLPVQPDLPSKSAENPMQSAEWIVIGHPVAKSHYTKEPDRFSKVVRENSAPVIIPVGKSGELIWRSLPATLATLVDHPLHSALVVMRATDFTAEFLDNLWENLSDQSNDISISDVMIDADNEIKSFPDLVPSNETIPAWLKNRIAQFRCETARSKPDEIAIRAGLLQIHDQLEPSHQQSQRCEGEGLHAAGDYWHAIMHRREPDYGNSKYWFRRVGAHPLFAQLADDAAGFLERCESPDAPRWKSNLTSNGWDAFAFVDLCEHCQRSRDSSLTKTARQIQWREMVLLLRQTWIDATGGEAS